MELKGQATLKTLTAKERRFKDVSLIDTIKVSDLVQLSGGSHTVPSEKSYSRSVSAQFSFTECLERYVSEHELRSAVAPFIGGQFAVFDSQVNCRASVRVIDLLSDSESKVVADAARNSESTDMSTSFDKRIQELKLNQNDIRPILIRASYVTVDKDHKPVMRPVQPPFVAILAKRLDALPSTYTRMWNQDLKRNITNFGQIYDLFGKLNNDGDLERFQVVGLTGRSMGGYRYATTTTGGWFSHTETIQVVTFVALGGLEPKGKPRISLKVWLKTEIEKNDIETDLQQPPLGRVCYALIYVDPQPREPKPSSEYLKIAGLLDDKKLSFGIDDICSHD